MARIDEIKEEVNRLHSYYWMIRELEYTPERVDDTRRVLKKGRMATTGEIASHHPIYRDFGNFLDGQFREVQKVLHRMERRIAEEEMRHF